MYEQIYPYLGFYQIGEKEEQQGQGFSFSSERILKIINHENEQERVGGEVREEKLRSPDETDTLREYEQLNDQEQDILPPVSPEYSTMDIISCHP